MRRQKRHREAFSWALRPAEAPTSCLVCLRRQPGIDVKYVEAGSDTEKLTALVGGSINAALVNQNQAKQYVESGKAKALGCFSVDETGGESAILPGVTSFVDQGYDCTFTTLFLVLGPKDMKAETVTALHDYFESAVVNPEVQNVLKPAGFDMTFFSQEEGLQKVKDQQESLNSVVVCLD